MPQTLTTASLFLLTLSLLGCADLTLNRAQDKKAATPVAVIPPVDDSPQVPAGYTLVWNDEFDGSGLPDADKWYFETWGNSIGWGNGEIQQYTVGDLDNAYQAGGLLNIVARKETVSGWCQATSGFDPQAT